jgi:hypothetical protein
MSGKCFLRLAMFVFFGSLPVFAVGPSFHPDAKFTGSTLEGWHTVGPAEWRGENGEIIGTPKEDHGGWLVLDHSGSPKRHPPLGAQALSVHFPTTIPRVLLSPSGR